MFTKFLYNVIFPAVYPALIALVFLVFFSVSKAQASDFEISLSPEFEHMSHASQHAPFTSSPTSYGANMVGVGLNVMFKQLTVSFVESYNLSPTYMVYGKYQECGEIMGGREEFSLRISYKFVIFAR